ncbi:alpha-glucuronidase [Hymenobacter sp. RP-2-7]|uniref:Alpha-glucuronidase n=1 Tax=Hymenobacter polaris TaxID=2682546 RepID=A0A7Y0AH34_9BACT|nr:alpha-glucuronidase [Hymenobacter polaris]NML67222.1 alpha-glucuronidase [Hymenobacter polaris]
MKKLLFSFCLLGASLGLRAEDGHQLWLRPHPAAPVKVVATAKNSALLATARQELARGWQGPAGATVTLTLRPDKALKPDGFRLGPTSVQAATAAGLLYGAFELLRRQQTGQPVTTEVVNPSYERRLLNHWDNPDGSVERGYAGHSIFWRKDSSFVVTPRDKALWQAYARANASVGLNGSVLNNVNASPLILSAEYLGRARAIADVLRPYGVRVYLAVKFSSPVLLGGLKTADPLDPAVIKWWRGKVQEVYRQIPDFGGLLVKASSEGQPGPQDYGRTHADGANMLADALRPYGGLVMWRAFVYSPSDKDRAKQAYNEFKPLDGKFRDNVIVQVKNGPIDFQPREPFSPLFGALKKTSVMPEFQITQEYLGQAIDLVFLSTMWEECLRSDTYQAGPGSTVARCTDGSVYPQKHTAMAGVSNVGLDPNWTGQDFAQANWYAFGRLAWNNQLPSAQIADEWLKQTFANSAAGPRPATAADWNTNFLAPVTQLLLTSREAAVNYSMPLGLHHIMSATHAHYGPGPWWAPPGMRPDWTPPYYHQADASGVGFDRTTTGSNAVSQYHEPLAAQFNNPATCPDEYLLWFHHLPWDFKMKSGRSLWDELCAHYDLGVHQVRQFQQVWDQAQPYVDAERFAAVQDKLRTQSGNAVVWKDACLLYFQQFSHRPIPATVEPPMHTLEALITNDVQHKDAGPAN